MLRPLGSGCPTGAAALMKDANPYAPWAVIKEGLLWGADQVHGSMLVVANARVLSSKACTPASEDYTYKLLFSEILSWDKLLSFQPDKTWFLNVVPLSNVTRMHLSSPNTILLGKGLRITLLGNLISVTRKRMVFELLPQKVPAGDA